jgi:hypothetical protein
MWIFLHFIPARVINFVQKQVLSNEQNLTKFQKPKLLISKVNKTEQNLMTRNKSFVYFHSLLWISVHMFTMLYNQSYNELFY